MSGTYPSDPEFTAINFRSEFATVVEETISLATDGAQFGGHRFSFTARYRDLTWSEFASVEAFLIQQKGGAETFQIVLPTLSYNSGTATSASTSGGAAIGATSVGVTMTGTLPKGSLFKFNNHSKVYMATADRSGTGTLSFYPPLEVAVSTAQAMTIDAVPFTVRQRRPMQEYGHPGYDRFNAQVDFLEDL